MRYCFYSEYKDLKGGLTTLIITLIKELYFQGEQVLLINYKDGLIASELEKSGVKVTILDREELTRNNIGSYVRESDLFIVSKFYEYLKILLEINPRVIYYDINDYIANISGYKFRLKLQFLGRKLIQKLLDSNSLLFMDDTGINNIQQSFSLQVSQPKFLPITVPELKENSYLDAVRDLRMKLRLTYVGRSVNWKMNPLKKILDDCNGLKKNIWFNIVVDNKIALENHIDLSRYKNVHIAVYENLRPSEINTFLLNNSDLHFGMGTAALHSAALGIPTILIDYSIHTFPSDYTYRWLFDTKLFGLGKNIDKVSFPKGMAMNEVLENILDEKIRVRLSKSSFSYIAENHTANIAVKKLITYGIQSTFRFRDAKKMIPYYYDSHILIKDLFSLFTK